jgi:hypothetical protein
LHSASAFHQPGQRYVGEGIQNFLDYFQARLVALAENVAHYRTAYPDKVGKLGRAELPGIQQFTNAIYHN